MVNKESVNKSISEVTKLLLDQGLNGEEYLLVLQTLVAQVLSVNALAVKRIWLMNVNADVRVRRIAKLKVEGVK